MVFGIIGALGVANRGSSNEPLIRVHYAVNGGSTSVPLVVYSGGERVWTVEPNTSWTGTLTTHMDFRVDCDGSDREILSMRLGDDPPPRAVQELSVSCEISPSNWLSCSKEGTMIDGRRWRLRAAPGDTCSVE
jgi:hypothetical protein